MSSIIASLGYSAGGMGVSTVLNAPLADYAKKLNKLYLPNIPDIPALILMRMRGEMTQDEFLDLAMQNGFPTGYAERMFRSGHELATLQATIIRYRRKEITEQQAFAEAERLGVYADEFKKMLSASLEQITPQDLIEFMVREVYTPAIREKFEQDAEFPDAALAEASKIGVPEKYIRDKWAAHWQLPDMEQAFRMLFRYDPKDIQYWQDEVKEIGLDPSKLATDLDTLRLLAKTKDIMRYWRERYIGIAYDALGRIDIRRMVKLRILNFGETVYQYKKIGLTPKDAKRLAWFSLIFESLPDWQAMLKDTQITIDEIKAEMTEWQVPQDIQAKIIKLKLLPVTQGQIAQYKEITVGLIKQAFKADQIERLQVIDLLKRLNYTEDNAKFIYEIWDHEKNDVKRKQRDLSWSEETKLFTLGRIDEVELTRRGIAMGWDRDEVADKIYIIKAKMQADADKAAAKTTTGGK